jgi:hypothetical protein
MRKGPAFRPAQVVSLKGAQQLASRAAFDYTVFGTNVVILRYRGYDCAA